MSTLSRESIIRQLRDHGFSQQQAEAAADRELTLEQIPRPQRFGAPVGVELVRPPALEQLMRAPDPAPGPPPPAIEWPVRLLLPWSLLVSDNDRKEPYLVYGSDGMRERPSARMRLTSKYREAKAKIEQLAKGKLAGAAAAEIPLELTSRVWIPGGSWRSDVANFSKGVHDALEGIVYKNDQLLYWSHWLRVGVDVDAPRAEITITPLPTSGG